MSVDTGVESRPQALAALRALATAFSVTALYPDPAGQPGFVTALAALSAHTEPVILVVGPGSVLFDGEELDPGNETAHRLARELFIREIEVVRLLPPVAEADLLAFFRTLAVDEDELRDDGGLRSVLAASGSKSVEVYERGMLAGGSGSGEHSGYEPPEPDLDELSDLAAAAHRGIPPSVLATMLDEEADGEVVAGFLDGLGELYDHASPQAGNQIESLRALDAERNDAWRGFRSFMESFFFLPADKQLEILETVLAEESTWGRLLVDQLSGAELAEFYGRLSDGGKDRLAAYAAVVSSEQGRPIDEIISTMPSQAEVSTAKRVVASRISEVLGEATSGRDVVQELIEAVRGQIETPPDDDLEVDVLRGLMECEDRTDRFKRIVRVWSGRVARYYRNGDLRRGTRLLEAVTADPPYERGRQPIVSDGLARIADRNTIRLALSHESGSEPSPEALEMVSALGSAAAAPLITSLAQEDDGRRRRLLTELLAAAARHDPASLDPYLSNQPWFVLRNLATVLGKTGRPTALAGTRRLLAHDDHRVRVEAARALARLAGDAAAPTLVRLLADENERVRQTAASLARGITSDELDRLLVAEVQGGRLGAEEAQVAIRILGSRRNDIGLELLRKLAAVRFAFGSRRHIRTAAREALGETS